MTSKDPSYPTRLFAILFLASLPAPPPLPKTTSWTLASLISMFLGSGWAQCTQLCLCCRTCLGAHAGRRLQTFGTSHHMGKLGPARGSSGALGHTRGSCVSSLVPG